MNRRYFNAAADYDACPRCGALPGGACSTPSYYARMPHKDRPRREPQKEEISMPMSRPPTVVRQISTPYVTISARCRLCKLFIDEKYYARLDVLYGGKDVMPKNELCALNRSSWICHACIAVIQAKG